MASPFSNAGKTVIKPVHLAHFVLKTQPSQFTSLVSFYKTFLSATATHENDLMSFLTYDSEHHRVAIICLPGTGPRVPHSSGLLHVSFTFATITDLLLAYRQRKTQGIEPFWCVNHGPTTSLYYRDPDGNEVETQAENFETAEEANRFMLSKEFHGNPIGTDFDPEALIRRIESGEDMKSIKKRNEIGARTKVPESIGSL